MYTFVRDTYVREQREMKMMRVRSENNESNECRLHILRKKYAVSAFCYRVLRHKRIIRS